MKLLLAEKLRFAVILLVEGVCCVSHEPLLMRKRCCCNGFTGGETWCDCVVTADRF